MQSNDSFESGLGRDKHLHHPGDRRRGGLDTGPGFGPTGSRGRRRGRGRRGDVRSAALILLDQQPLHGYQLIQEIAERSNGVWTPSPGSIYPSLQQLEDEGLISFERVDGRKTATLTDVGKAYVEENREALGTPWDEAGRPGGSEYRDLKESLRTLMIAWKQIVDVGTPEQKTKATEVILDSRKALYRILAEDEPAS